VLEDLDGVGLMACQQHETVVVMTMMNDKI